jgi:hypothetical protein
MQAILDIPVIPDWPKTRTIAQQHYVVAYDNHLDKAPQRVLNQDQSLYPLKEKLEFELDENAKVLYVRSTGLLNID